MTFRRILTTGGAGFVGSALCLLIKQRHPEVEITALDNLRRRGSEMNVRRLLEAGVRFVHGDVRCPDDLRFLGDPVDLILECSAEPSVLAGVDGSPAYVIDTNLLGTVNCLELARRDEAAFLFLSTSRVYPIPALNQLVLMETDTRFALAEQQPVAGAGSLGISEDFPLAGPRTLYGATKLSSELLIEEYRETFGIRTLINRCGVLAGPWQMGKVDQGFVAHWLLAHHYGRPLKYLGYGGTGRQVRDILHVCDLHELIELELLQWDRLNGATFNVGGGVEGSVSLCEATDICREITRREVPIEAVSETRKGDIPLFITDHSRVTGATGWRPQRGPERVFEDTYRWIREHETALQEVLSLA